MKIKRPELLVPAGSLEVLKCAVNFGADAVYIGGDAFSLRAKARNFSLSDMKEGISYAHSRGVKVYVAVNVFARNDDVEEAKRYLAKVRDAGADAVIISDPDIFAAAREAVPDMDIHISTQANNTNYASFNFWHSLGAKRVVAARELSLEEIRHIRENIPDDLEIEAFVHGAMCISYSGRCLMSNFLAGRDANRGECSHPCRWKYLVVEEKRPGQYFPVLEDENGTYIFNSKDLCMIGHIPEMIGAGIDSFKIEGRMKNALYVAVAARTYRRAIDDYFKDENLYKSSLPYYSEEISKCTYRDFTTGFFFGKPNEDSQIYDSNTYQRGYTYLGIVNGQNESGMYGLNQRNKFCTGENIEIMRPDGNDICTEVTGMCDEEGNTILSCPHPNEKIFVDLGVPLEDGDILRRRENSRAQESR